MARDGGRERGTAARGRGRPKKNTGVRLNLDPESRPSTSTPTTTTTTTPPFVATGGLSAGLPEMSSETGDASPVPETQTSSQPPPTPDTDVADEETEAVASAKADTRPLLIWDGHDCWDDVKKETMEITNVFQEHYEWYAPSSAKHLMRQSSSSGRGGE
ncbi:hypothetical protein PIB30_046506 [Stylosanthes scabra]|uniref:Uncharacterized protein n=1 Tax=Stylosanthes scabra TaxID=79078 RepID=A0ABU6XGP4_9FABA|nr:hypothetical protein [Stylosanthes scabra]